MVANFEHFIMVYIDLYWVHRLTKEENNPYVTLPHAFNHYSYQLAWSYTGLQYANIYPRIIPKLSSLEKKEPPLNIVTVSLPNIR